MTRYPNSADDEVSVWLEMKHHEPTKSFETLSFGTEKGTVTLLAPQTIEDNHGQRYDSSNFKFESMAQGNISGSTFWMVGREVVGTPLGVIMGSAGQAAWQTLSNPYEQKIYQAPDFRTFTFRWELAPLNEGDADNIGTIIEDLTTASYPSRSGVSQWLSPDQFKLSFLLDSGGTISKIPIKFGKCVLTNIATNYTGAGQFRLSESGVPAFINLSLTFSETSVKDQDFFKPSKP